MLFLSVRTSDRRSLPPRFRSYAWNDSAPTGQIFMEFLRIFLKAVDKLKSSLKADKNDIYFTCIRVYIYDISLNSSSNEKYFGQICTENRKTRFVLILWIPSIAFILIVFV